MDIESISQILEDFSRAFTVGEVDREFFSDFVIYNDLGLPLAQCVIYELAQPTEQGKNVIMDTWNNLCELLDLDPDTEYEDFDEMLEEYDEE